MIKQFLVLITTLVFGSAFSQKQNQEKQFSFKIDGVIRNFSGKVIYVHHKWKDKTVTDSAKVNNGKFLFNLKAVEPNMYWFTVNSEPNAQPSYFFFTDNTTIKATLISDSLNYSFVEGGQNQKDYQEYKQMINTLVIQQQKMQADYGAASQSGNGAAMQAIQQDFQNLNMRYVSDLKEFVKKHPKSEMSCYIIAIDFSNENIPIENMLEALGNIDPSMAKNSYVVSANKKADAIKGTMVGYPANNFTQNTPEGKPVKLSDYKGKYVLIDFWASWCKPCRMENPNVVSAFNRFKDKGFTVLGVSMDSNKEAWVNAIRADNLTWQHVSDLKGWGNEVGIMYGVKGIPQNFLLDKEGKIVAKNLRGPELDEKLAEIIK